MAASMSEKLSSALSESALDAPARAAGRLSVLVNCFFVKNILRTILPSCRDMSRLQSDAMDTPLPLSMRFGVRLHLLVCSWCRRYGRQISFLRGAVHARPDNLAESEPQ